MGCVNRYILHASITHYVNILTWYGCQQLGSNCLIHAYVYLYDENNVLLTANNVMQLAYISSPPRRNCTGCVVLVRVTATDEWVDCHNVVRRCWIEGLEWLSH
jgi:hypothetical protein